MGLLSLEGEAPFATTSLKKRGVGLFLRVGLSCGRLQNEFLCEIPHLEAIVQGHMFKNSVYDNNLFVWFLVNFVDFLPLSVMSSPSFIRPFSCWCVWRCYLVSLLIELWVALFRGHSFFVLYSSSGAPFPPPSSPLNTTWVC